MKNELFIDTSCGISGDMVVAALLDLGASEEVLMENLASLSVKDAFLVHIKKIEKAGQLVCDFDVELTKKEHTHRTFLDVVKIINESSLSNHVKKIAIHIFDVLAEAEGMVHQVPKEQVHFHEVGAIDSIVDIVSFAICFDNLEIEKVYVPYVVDGYGTIMCQHGEISVPVPAVRQLSKLHDIEIRENGMEGEFVTPTGCAIVAGVRTDKEMPAWMKETNVYIGKGNGKREYERPSILRCYMLQK